MVTQSFRKPRRLPQQVLSILTITSFLFTNLSIINVSRASAQIAPSAGLNLPAVGTMLDLSESFSPVMVLGITIHPDDPLKFDFLLDVGDEQLTDEQIRQESTRLAKYFLATLTVPEEELWVNLSPYEKENMIPPAFGETEMGRDLLAQDYLLKQLTASLIYPEKELGSAFWNRVFDKAQERFGTTDIPLNTFNKIWIVPDRAAVYEQGSDVYIIDSHLKVMLEEDYKALQQNGLSKGQTAADIDESTKAIGEVSSDVVREVLIPEIEREVNTGKTFANLRQVYSSMILAAWYKEALRQSILGQVYVDQKKTFGVNNEDVMVNQKIYEQYLAAFKQGVYDFLKEEYDPVNREMVSRRYFSGGANLTMVRPMVRQNTMKASSPLKLSRKEQAAVMPVLDQIGNRTQANKVTRATVALSPQAGVKRQQERADVAGDVLTANFKAAGVTVPKSTVATMVKTLRGGDITQALESLPAKQRMDFVVATAQEIAPKMITENRPTLTNVLREGGIKNPDQEMARIQKEGGIQPFFSRQTEPVQQNIATAIIAAAARDEIMPVSSLASSLERNAGLSSGEAATMAKKITDNAKPQDIDKAMAAVTPPLTPPVQQQVRLNLAQSAVDAGGLDQSLLLGVFQGEKSKRDLVNIISKGQQNMDLNQALDTMEASPDVRKATTNNFASLGVTQVLTPSKVEATLARARVPNATEIASQIKTELSGRQDPINVLSTRLSSQNFDKAVSEIAVMGISQGAIQADERMFAALGNRAPEIATQLKEAKSSEDIDKIFSRESPAVKKAVLTELARPMLDQMDAAGLTQPLKAAGVDTPDTLANDIVVNRPSTSLSKILENQPAGVQATAIHELAQATVAERDNKPVGQQTMKQIFENSGHSADLAETAAKNIISGREATDLNKLFQQNNVSPENQQRVAAKLASEFFNRGNVVAPKVNLVSARPEDVGGIDFNPSMLALEIRKDGRGVPLPISQQPLMNIPLDGFVPVVEDVTPVTNFSAADGA